jgi:ABC-type polysaccharide/polyol phosphate transport system ATPase subunit
MQQIPMSDLVVDRVSKRYHVTEAEDGGGVFDRTLRALRPRKKEFWALRDVSFDVRRGETLGIIGANGAGKSTILKLLSGITAPTSGQIVIRGRLSALIEVGSGFHPELTGRENVYLSGSILGMRRREIVTKLDRIVEFAGVREFIDTPVKRYSSGMYLRLGFSIAAHLEPDILLLDEVLAVGDADFQLKCLDRIRELHQHGRTIIFISHDLGAVERLCGRVLLMDRGRIMAEGPPNEITAKYHDIGGRVAAAGGAALSREAEITGVTCYDAAGRPTTTLRSGSAAMLTVEYLAHQPIEDAVVEVYFLAVDGGAQVPWCQLTTAALDGPGIRLDSGPGVITFEIETISLMPDLFYLTVSIRARTTPDAAIDRRIRCVTVRIEPGTAARGSFYMPHRWRQDVSARMPGPADTSKADARLGPRSE